jgi:hypothetical protein
MPLNFKTVVNPDKHNLKKLPTLKNQSEKTFDKKLEHFDGGVKNTLDEILEEDNTE